MSSSSPLRESLRAQRKNLIAAIVLVAGHQAGEALVPVVIGVVIDRAVHADGNGFGVLLWWLLVLAVLFAAFSTSYRLGARFGLRGDERAAHALRMRLTERVLDERGGADTGTLVGELTSVATGDARRVGTAIQVLPFGFAAVAGLTVAAIALLSISWPLGLIVLLGAPLLLLAAQLLGKPLQRRSETEQEHVADAAGVAADLVTGVRILKGLGADSTAADRYRQLSRRSLDATVRAARTGSWHDGGMVLVNGLLLAAVAAVGGTLAARSSISVGDLIAAVGLAQYLLGPLGMFTWVNGEIAQARASSKRIADVLDSEPAVLAGQRSTVPVGDIELRAVRCATLRLDDVRITAGKTTAIVADPAHAATLCRLLNREQDPEHGAITIGGVELAQWQLSTLRASVVVSEHDTTLFDGPLSDIVDPATSQRVLSASGTDEVLRALPDGLDTTIGEGGRALSGGQRQRVALARALATEAAVLVLHDPTTAVDPVTESNIAAALGPARHGLTTIIFTTSAALLAAADEVIVLADGSRGTHRTLLDEHDDYRAAVLA